MSTSLDRSLLFPLVVAAALALPAPTGAISGPERAAMAASLESQAGGTWVFAWDGAGIPRRAYGAPLRLSSAPLESPAEVAEAVRAFVAERERLLGVSAAEVRFRSIVSGPGTWGVVLDQLHHGIEVEGACLRFALTESGSLYAFSSGCHPRIEVDPAPSLDRAAACAAAAGGRVEEEASGGEAKLVILPLETGECRLAWRVRRKAEERPALWVTWVDAHTGRILRRHNDAAFLDVIGRTAADVEDPGYCDGEQDRRMPNLSVEIAGGSSGFSDRNGEFDLPHAGTDPVLVSARLAGRWVEVTNVLGPAPVLTGVAVPGVPLELRWTDASSLDSERSSYFHANRIHDMVKSHDPSWTAPDYPMPVTVNAGFTCGAYWDGTGIQLGRPGNGCADIARMGDIVYHEYTHGITQWIYGGNPPDVGEGNSDVAVFLLTGDPVIGEGFYQGDCATGIRDVRNTLRYPEDYIPGDPFHNGLIISGFWWDVREGLVPVYGEEEADDILWRDWHLGRRMYQPVEMPDQVFYAFVADDDDGDLTNGTPHYPELCAAATIHGFECPLSATGMEEDDSPIVVDEGLRSSPNPTAGSARIFFRVENRPARVYLSAHDVTGRTVRKLVDGVRVPGPCAIIWDGRDDGGRMLPAGIYYLELKVSDRRSTRPVVLLR